MSNTNFKIVYSLRMHLLLQQQGFVYLTEMKNPKNPNFMCWVYERTPQFQDAFDKIVGGAV